MTQKIILSSPRPHQSQDFAADMLRRNLLQNFNVHPALDLNGEATGMFEVPADFVPGVMRNPTTSDEINRNDL